MELLILDAEKENMRVDLKRYENALNKAKADNAMLYKKLKKAIAAGNEKEMLLKSVARENALLKDALEHLNKQLKEKNWKNCNYSGCNCNSGDTEFSVPRKDYTPKNEQEKEKLSEILKILDGADVRIITSMENKCRESNGLNFKELEALAMAFAAANAVTKTN